MKYEEDPLEQLLDEQADGDFGNPEFKEHFDGNLANWSAKDFSDIYVRFHPHLLRHAKRYLTNHAQAEEVVQDAFLYLMTSLPEIDSEIGVLKLLKWKVRLLALDVIKLNGKASLVPVDEQYDLVSDEAELDQNLIRADEAAIVSMALAKLNPRQREALIASVYQEKETFEVASQLGLSENATRQLLFRAKSAFKKALIGEAETAGLSVSQILSIAARKAAQDAGKYISAASALLVVMAISLGVIPNLPQTSEAPIAASAPENTTPLAPSETAEPAPAPAALEPTSEPAPETQPIEPAAESETLLVAAEETEPTATTVAAAPAQEAAAIQPAAGQPQIRTASLTPYLSLSVQQAEVAREGTEFFPNASSVIKIHSGVGLWAYVDYEPTTMTINAVGFEIMIDGQRYFASPRTFGTATSESASGYTLTYSATEIFLIDADRNVISDQELASAFVTIALQLGLDGEPLGANLHFTAD